MHNRFSSLMVLLLGFTSLSLPARAEETLRPEIEIDRSVLEDLKGYQPPPMFGSAARAKPVPTPAKPVTTPAAAPVPAPLKRVPVAPQEATLTVPKAEDVLEFPVQNDEIVTRQRLSGPEETVTSARPDYSDSHTKLQTLDTPNAKIKASQKKVDLTPKRAAKPATKAPIPARKPDADTDTAAKPEAAKTETAKVEIKEADKPKADAKKPEDKSPVTAAIAAPEPQEEPVDTVMTPMPPAEKYVPKSRPSMPAVSMDKVEKTKLDPFALPVDATLGDETVVAEAKPTPGEKLMDQALTRNMVKADKKAVESALDGKAAAATAPEAAPMVVASLAPDLSKTDLVSIEFKPHFTELQKDQKDMLASGIVGRLQKKTAERLQIQAFASGASTNTDARRTSLARALSVRAYLLEMGVSPSRLDIQALGDNTKEEPLDRVDLKFSKK